MGFIVIGGLITSTMLTLIVIPAAWMLPEEAALMWRRVVSRVSAEKERLGPQGSPAAADTAAVTQDKSSMAVPRLHALEVR
jgi:HAE1 family hydrophobic/amphiphilic exporter-1